MGGVNHTWTESWTAGDMETAVQALGGTLGH